MRVVDNNNNFFRTSNIEKDRIWLKLTNEENVFRQILIAFIDEASDNYDAYDGKRLENGTNTDFWRNRQKVG